MSRRVVKCRSCNAPMAFAISLDELGNVRRKPTGDPKFVPINPDPDPDGNLLLVRRSNGGQAVRPLGPTEYAETSQRRTAHFATCPAADKHRRKDT